MSIIIKCLNNIMNKILCFIIVFLLYIVLDGTMIALFMGKYFGGVVQKIQGGRKMGARIIPAVLCFLILAFGIVYFVLDRIRDDHIVEDSFRYGGVFGAVVYGVFDLTNYAIFTDYTAGTVLIDMAWGTILASVVSMITKFLFVKKR